MIATVRHDSFDLTPLASEERCTPLSVAAHTLYEKTRPDRLPGPGGILELDNASYEQITEKTTRIKGAEFVPSTTYQSSSKVSNTLATERSSSEESVIRS